MGAVGAGTNAAKCAKNWILSRKTVRMAVLIPVPKPVRIPVLITVRLPVPIQVPIPVPFPVPSVGYPTTSALKSSIFRLLPHAQCNEIAGYLKETRILSLISVRVMVQDPLLISRCDELLLP